MSKLLKYETPEIEITSFEVNRDLMNVVGPGGADGEEITTRIDGTSEVETSGLEIWE